MGEARRHTCRLVQQDNGCRSLNNRVTHPTEGAARAEITSRRDLLWGEAQRRRSPRRSDSVVGQRARARSEVGLRGASQASSARKRADLRQKTMVTFGGASKPAYCTAVARWRSDL